MARMDAVHARKRAGGFVPVRTLPPTGRLPRVVAVMVVVAAVGIPTGEARAEAFGTPPGRPGVAGPKHLGHRLGLGLGLGEKVSRRPSHPNAYQDGLAVHAGGAYAGQIDSLIKHGEVPRKECRGGDCGDNCVVVPERFGYYGTRWRMWPGTKVVQTAGVAELTPVSPPAKELPGPAEESRDPKVPIDFGVDDSTVDPQGVTLPGLGPAPRPETSPPEPPAATKPDREPPPPQPQPEPQATAPPQPEPPPVQPEPPKQEEPKPSKKDDDLFDEAAGGLKLNERLAKLRADAMHRKAMTDPVPFDEAASSRPIDPSAPVPAAVRPTGGRLDAARGGSRSFEPRPNPLRR